MSPERTNQTSELHLNASVLQLSVPTYFDLDLRKDSREGGAMLERRGASMQPYLDDQATPREDWAA